ncbi:polyferredoxin [Cryobacterium psychrotolerans]|nr:polyferredoxin [Cryobacterium psychrotolerans]
MFVPGIDPFLRAVGATTAGLFIGGGLQLNPLTLLRKAVSHPNPNLGWILIAASVALATSFGVLIVFRLWTDGWVSFGFLILGLAVCALGSGLGYLYPGDKKHPEVFLLPVGFNCLLLFETGLHTDASSFPLTVMVFVPALVVSVVLTVWAFQIRGATTAEYAKATEVARGVFWGWILLFAASVFSSMVGIELDGKDSLDPLRFLLPLVTFGSVIAAVTSGFSRYSEVHAALKFGASVSETERPRPDPRDAQ